MIDRLRDHYVICSYGRVGRRVADVFRESGVDYVVLDFDADALDAAREHGDLYIDGNGTNDDDLEAVGLARARGLVASSEPYSAAGREMGILVLEPQVAAFLDAASIAGGQDLHFEEALAG